MTSTKKLTFHQKTCDLLIVQPQYTEEVSAKLSRFETQTGLTIPAALREWHCIAGNSEYLQKIIFPHELADVADMSTWMSSYSTSNRALEKILPIIFENQGVWHMIVPLDQGEDPPVYIGFYEESFEWKLHANSLSDCFYAFAWDNFILRHISQMDPLSIMEPLSQGVRSKN